MKLKNKLFKKFVAGIVTSVFMLSVAPQLPIQNNIATVEAAKVKLNVKKVTLSKGKTKKLILKNAVGKVKWKSSKTSIATVSKKGVVTAKKAGKATITAKCKGQKYTCKVTVKSSTGSSGSSSGNGSSKKESYSTVYWTPSGEVYHKSRNCSTLSRSKTIYSGSPSESGKDRACKVCS